MTNYAGTAGNDTFALVAGDTVNGGAGDDSITMDLSGQTGAVTYNAVAAATNTGMAAITGTTVRNVEHISELKTGSGNDSLTISLAQDSFTWYAGGGNDRLILNYSTATSDIGAGMNGSYYYVAITNSKAYAIEGVTITGGSGDDNLSGTAGRDVLTGGDGDDVLDGGKGVSVLDGGAGADTVSLDLSSATAAILYDGIAAMTATGITLADGSSAKNVEGLDELSTGGGNDVLTVSMAQGSFIWHAGAGADRLVVDYSAATSAISANINGSYYYLSNTNSEAYDIQSVSITGGSGADTLVGTDGDDVLAGGGGNDELYGGTGVSTIDGGAGSDTYSLDLSAATTNLHFDAIAAATAAGTTVEDGSSVRNAEKLIDFSTGSGDDTLTISKAQGDVAWHAGDGNDRLIADYSADTSGFEAHINGGYYYITATDTQVYDVESVSIKGGSGADTLTGTSGNDALNGGGGGDYINGLTGVSTLDGGAGIDTVALDLSDATAAINYDAGAAATATGIVLADGSTVRNAEKLDELDTGAFNDTLTVKISNGAFIWHAGDGNDRLIADYSTDTHGFSAAMNGAYYYLDVSQGEAYDIESVKIIGGSGADDLTGTAGDDDLTGSGGDDRIDGGDGIDTAAYRNATSGVTVSLLLQGTIQNTVNAGHDTLNNIENLTGSAFADTLTGDNNRNIIDGGAAGDTMTGGGGNDDYYVDNAADKVNEAAGGGTDTVYASVSFSAGSQDIENITLTGVLNTSAYGNTLDNTLIGNGGNNTLAGGTGADSMSGGLGNDIYYVDNAGDNVNEKGEGGNDTVYSLINYTLGANVENLTLQAGKAVSATGNGLSNIIHGNGNGNLIDGAAGADGMYGGAGNDTYIVDNTGDGVSEHNTAGEDGGGIDTVRSSISYILGEDLENLTLTGTAAINGSGNGLDNVVTGNDAANVLRGYAGNDVIDGGSGGDAMYGGAGDDTYHVDDAADRVSEISSGVQDDGGKDTVIAGISYTLGAYVENLTLSGTANINASGNALMNIIFGNGGNNVIDGKAGADAMWGGAGNDDYYVDNAFDVVSELNGTGGNAGGIDTVHTAIDYQLAIYVENIELLGTAALAVGNELNNSLTGNASDNDLRGMDGNDAINAREGDDRIDGGAGNDAMYGGAGNDTYIVDSSGDGVSEQRVLGHDDGGIDTVWSSVSYALGAFVENLTLLGAGTISAGGNALDNVLTGNDGANTLTGLGGNDTLLGGAGADTFRFAPGSGADTIMDFSLADGDTIFAHDYAGTAHTITQSGQNVVIDFGNGNTITVLHADAGDPNFLNAVVF